MKERTTGIYADYPYIVYGYLAFVLTVAKIFIWYHNKQYFIITKFVMIRGHCHCTGTSNSLMIYLWYDSSSVVSS